MTDHPKTRRWRRRSVSCWSPTTFGVDFACSDGERVMVVALTPAQWIALVRVIGTADRSRPSASCEARRGRGRGRAQRRRPRRVANGDSPRRPAARESLPRAARPCRATQSSPPTPRQEAALGAFGLDQYRFADNGTSNRGAVRHQGLLPDQGRAAQAASGQVAAEPQPTDAAPTHRRHAHRHRPGRTPSCWTPLGLPRAAGRYLYIVIRYERTRNRRPRWSARHQATIAPTGAWSVSS
jgi:hypothetical protein